MSSSSTTEFFRPRRLGHVNLWVADLKTSERFYNEVCGLTVEFTEPGLVATFLGTGHTPHDLGMIEKTDGKPRYGRDGLLQLPPGIGLGVGLNHLAWELENEADLVRAYKAMKAKNIPTDMTVDHQVAHSVYMFDPDMNSIEFYCDTVKDWRTVLRGEMDLITSAWDPLTAEGFTQGRYDENPEIRTVASAPVHPRRITHAVLETEDVNRLVEFYSTIAGLRVVGRPFGGRVVLLAGTLGEYPYSLAIAQGAKAAYHHAAFELADEAALEAAKGALTGKGLTLAAETDVPWKRSIFLRDPDGLLSEYYVRRGEMKGEDSVKTTLAPAFLI